MESIKRTERSRRIRERQSYQFNDEKIREKIKNGYDDAIKLIPIIEKEIEKGKKIQEAVLRVLNDELILKIYPSLQDENIRNKVANLIRQKLYIIKEKDGMDR